MPFWSPDGRSIGFFAVGALKRLDLGGGAPQTLAPAINGAGGTWNADDVIVFAPTLGTPLMRVSATGGETVALVCSGDAGIYALATLVFELLDREDRPTWNRLDIRVVPGISALQAAAARLGAPLGHDFCAISLSDLLTAWSVIERRLRAAAEGDFVIAFYNPVSQRRRHQLEAARDILLAHRPADTPVALARNLGREGESLAVIRLADLRANHADMLTLVLVGSSQSRLTRRGRHQWLYTPRGYNLHAERER